MATLTQPGAVRAPKPRTDGLLAILGSIPLAIVFLPSVTTAR